MSERIFSLASLTVLELSPPEMVDVAARAGYSHVGLRLVPATPEEHHFALVADAGLRRQTLARLRDTGLRVLDVEILRLKPDTVVAEFEKVLAVGAEFGATELLVAGNDVDEQRLTDNFALLCDLAAPYGLHPHLEFMPWTDARNLSKPCASSRQPGAKTVQCWWMRSISIAPGRGWKIWPGSPFAATVCAVM
jgi:sugar phosphate isomerase/epimerase